LRRLLPDRDIAVEACRSQIGSGALPVDLLASFAVTVAGAGLEALAAAWRGLARPVLGRIGQHRLWLDCRCLEAADEADLLRQFADCASPVRTR
jgi:L-seryl-tRNA(Ser) seleniumtransferase